MTGRQPLRIRAADAALMLGCSVRLAQKLLATGALQGAKVGAIWTTTAADVQVYLLRHSNTPSRPNPIARLSRPVQGRASRQTDAARDEAYERVMGRRPGSPSGRDRT